MKKFNAFLVSVLAVAALNAAVIEQVIVRQQWPWSTDIKVEYKLSGVAAPVDIDIKAYNGNVELSLPAAAVKGERYGISEDWVGTIVIDPVAAFGNVKVALANFKVKLTVSDSPENLDEVVYKVFSLTNSTEATVDITRKELLNGKYGPVVTDYAAIGNGFKTSLSDVLIWTGVTNNIKYKTTHLVMRKIPAKSYGTWKIGSPTEELGREPSNSMPETQHTVQLTENYYIGVFELTQAQYANIAKQWTSTGLWPSTYASDDRDVHPLETIQYDQLRHHLDNWPTRQPLHYMGPTRSVLLSWIRRCTAGNFEFDLPTEAQWEFACRAGTETAQNDGREYTTSKTRLANTRELAWFYDNATTTMEVGLLKPNAYGLYDMHGNVSEWCVDWATPEIDVEGTGDPLTDPKGATEGLYGHRAIRGGAYDYAGGQINYFRSAYRYRRLPSGSWNWIGLRLVCPENATW